MTPSEQPTLVLRTDGHGTKLLHKGTLAEFDIECYAACEPVANILFYADVAEKISITAAADTFLVHLKNKDVEFVLKTKLYTAFCIDWNKNNEIKKNIYQAHFSSVSELEKYYNAKEQKDAWETWKFIKGSLTGSRDEAIRLATFG